MSRILERCSECLGLRVSVSEIIYISTIVLPLLLSGCADKGFKVTNIYVNNSGHDINVTSNGGDEFWVKRFTFNLPNGESYSLTENIIEKNYNSRTSDVIFSNHLALVNVDYGQDVQATYKPDGSWNAKRNIFLEECYDKEVKRNDNKKYEAVLTFTFTQQDYLDAM